MFNFVDLEFSELVRQKIKHETQGDMTYISDGSQHHFVRDSKILTKVWKEKLDPKTVAWIKETTADICDHFFDESSWS